MKKLTNIVILIAFIGLGIFAYIQWKKAQRQIPLPEKIYEYITDTIYKNKYGIYKPDSNSIYTPPKRVIIYKEPKINSGSLTEIDSSWYSGTISILDSVPGQVMQFIDQFNPNGIIRPEKFITFESWAPKLIGLEITKKQLKLTVLDTVAKLYTLIYPTDYNYYDYYYAKKGLYRESTNYVEKRKIDWKALYLNVDYDFTLNRPAIFLDYNVDINRMRFGTELRGTFTDVEPLGFRIKVGYRLFK